MRHEGKQVAGHHVEAGAGGPDEDTFVLPAAWVRLVEPRRGGAARAVPAPAPGVVERAQQRIAAGQDWIESVLTSPRTDPALARAARAYLAGEPDPVGAAAVAGMLPSSWQDEGYETSTFADAWAVRHGLAFAARAALEIFDVEVTWRQQGSVRSEQVLRFRAPTAQLHAHAVRPPANRVRALLATADEDAYREAVAALADCRTTPRRRVVAAFLAPGTPGWADACLAEEPGHGDGRPALWWMLLAALDRPEQLDRLGPLTRLHWISWSVDPVATLADGIGAACVPLLGPVLDHTSRSEQLRDLAAAVVQFPTDDAFRLLLDRREQKPVRPALQEAMRRYPVRAVRLLAAAALADDPGAATARQLLRTQLALNPAALPEVLPQLDEQSAELVHSLDGSRGRVAAATPEALPPLLLSPPWTRPRTSRRARVLDGLQPDGTAQLVWLPGEQQSWAGTEAPAWQYPAATDWAAEAADAFRNRDSLWWAGRLLMQGPVEVLTPWLTGWRPTELRRGQEQLRPVVARYGLAALPMAAAVAAAQPGTLAPLLLPFLDVAAARVMADCLVRLKSMQQTARSWFDRHGVPAALLLIPDAVGPAGRARDAAEQALRLVAGSAGRETVLTAVVGRYGEQAAEIAAEALATDPLESALPARMPVLPGWAHPAVLPQLLLHSGEALPDEAVRHVLTVLALSKQRDPYPGLAVVLETCRADSLAAFGWALFEEWRQASMPGGESWALHALGPLGDDDTARRLTPVLRDWPGQGAHHRAVEGLTVLAEIGSDSALLHLHTIAQRVRFKALKLRAQERIAEVAEGLGLTGEQLSDRLVPDLGLDPDGTTVVDYGPRRFTVGFDEQLRPFVLAADGRRLKDLPAPNAGDDPVLAPAERKRFVALKKEVRAVGADQVRRLEAAMVTRRGVTAAEFRELFVGHPLVGPLVRRLVWHAAGTDFRVTGDHRLTRLDGTEFALPEDATVGLPHPLELGGPAVAAWSRLFADVPQPFPQLDRPVHRLTPEESATDRLDRFEGSTVPVGRVLGLTKRGWQRGEPQDNGVECWISKRLGEGCHLVIDLDEGIAVGNLDVYPDQTFRTVWLGSAPGYHWADRHHPLRFGDLDPVAASELLADLEAVTAG
ncbi:DUF4132 domain-containing protein [Kitasatospora sp. NBC_00070]|uniref:DUF4132 domain-containing protein n=1 Tax=Kitasatospora sp. NBC_00070 TaxID=2975962 RepID=UPI003246DEB8